MRRPDPLRSRVVLIGTARYCDPRLPALPAVGKTVEDLARALTDPVYGVVPEEHCTELLDQDDLRTVGRRLRGAVDEAEDLLLVYYAGHGLVSGRRHDLYLALSDSESGAPEFNALEYDKLRGAVFDSPARHKIVILDCCFSGRVITDTLTGDDPGRLNQLEVPGTYLLTSAQREQMALSLPAEEHIAFTGRLIRLLTEGVVGGPELLTIEDLYQRLRRTMVAEGLSEPLSRATGAAQTIALGVNRAYAATAGPELNRRRTDAVRLGTEGGWSAAAAALREVLDEQTRILGARHLDTLLTRQAHAHALGGAGDPKEAARLLRELLAEHTQSAGPDHEDVLRTRQYLAVNLGEAGHRHDAVGRLRVLLADRSRVLGPEDPQTLRTRHMLARNLALTGARDEARALLRQLADERERTLGPDHPHTVRVAVDLAQLEAIG